MRVRAERRLRRGLEDERVVRGQRHRHDRVVVVVQQRRGRHRVGDVEQRRQVLLRREDFGDGLTSGGLNRNCGVRNGNEPLLIFPLDQVVGVERPVGAVAENAVDGGGRGAGGHLRELRRRRQADGRHRRRRRRVLLHRLLELPVDGQLQLQLVRVQRAQDLLIGRKNFGLERGRCDLQRLGLHHVLGFVAEVQNGG